LTLGRFLQDHLRHVLVADVTHAAVAANHPDFGQLDNFLVGHQGVSEVRELIILAIGDDAALRGAVRSIGNAGENDVGQALGNDRAAGVVNDEALAHEPAHRDAILEQRVHPRIRMRVIGRRRSIDRVAAGVGSHGHDTHAIGQAAVDGLQALVVESLGEQHGGDSLDELCVADGTMLLLICGDARLGVGVIFAAQAHYQVRQNLAQLLIFGEAARLEHRQLGDAGLLQFAGLGHEAVGLGVIHGPHVGLGDGRDRPQHALLAAARAGAVAGYKRVVVAAHHEHVAQRGGFRVGRVGGVEQAKGTSARCRAAG